MSGCDEEEEEAENNEFQELRSYCEFSCRLKEVGSRRIRQGGGKRRSWVEEEEELQMEEEEASCPSVSRGEERPPC